MHSLLHLHSTFRTSTLHSNSFVHTSASAPRIASSSFIPLRYTPQPSISFQERSVRYISFFHCLQSSRAYQWDLSPSCDVFTPLVIINKYPQKFPTTHQLCRKRNINWLFIPVLLVSILHSSCIPFRFFVPQNLHFISLSFHTLTTAPHSQRQNVNIPQAPFIPFHPCSHPPFPAVSSVSGGVLPHNYK